MTGRSQRFFAVEDAAGGLLPASVAVRDGTSAGEQARGEDVLAARLRTPALGDRPRTASLRGNARGRGVEGGLGTLRARPRARRRWSGGSPPASRRSEKHASRAALLCKTTCLR